jgi:integrase
MTRLKPDHTFKFTDAAVKKLSHPPAGHTFYWDRQLGRFGLRVSTRSKTYIVSTRVFRKGYWLPARRFTVGDSNLVSLADARDRATQMLRLAKARKDPVGIATAELSADTSRSANTFGAAAERFIRDYLKGGSSPELWKRRPGTIRAYTALFKSRDLAPWQDRPVSEIGVEDVEEVLSKIVRRGSPAMANRARAYLNKFFRWCSQTPIRVGQRPRLIEVIPTISIAAPTAERPPRDRVLLDQELTALWHALDQEHPPVAVAAKMLLLTGQRRNEIAGMRWSELHGVRRDDQAVLALSGEAAAWELPGRRAKNHRDHVIPLVPQHLALLSSLSPEDGDLIFTTNGIAPLHLGSKIKHRIDARLDPSVRSWTWHDLRRTFATGLARMRFSRFVIGKLLNHADRSVTAIYDRYEAFDEKRAALQAWVDHVDRLL